MPPLRFDRTLLTVVLGLTLLFTILDPAISAPLPVWITPLFWFLHIGIGMLLAVAATAGLSRRLPWIRQPAMGLVLVGGLIGSLLFAPVALTMDAVLLPETGPITPDDWLDEWEQQGGLLAVFAEWLSLLPAYLSSWMLVNVIPVRAQVIRPVVSEALAGESPAVQPATLTTETRQERRSDAADSGSPIEPASHEALPVTPELVELPRASPHPPTPDPSAAEDAAKLFLAALPPAIGRDLIAIHADLHYLQVRTSRGRAMVLASLSTAEKALGGRGLRVHRSHWVALAHVRRLAQTANGMTLELSDGSRIPVSRRRASEVRDRLGQGFVVGPDA